MRASCNQQYVDVKRLHIEEIFLKVLVFLGFWFGNLRQFHKGSKNHRVRETMESKKLLLEIFLSCLSRKTVSRKSI